MRRIVIPGDVDAGRHPFTFPPGTWHVPLDSTTPFALRRTTNAGQTIVSAPRYDYRDFVNGIAPVNSIQYLMGTAYADGGFGYVFQSGDGHPAGGAADTADLSDYHILLRIRYVKSTETTLSLKFMFRNASWSTPIYTMSFATNAFLTGSGVYTFSLCPSGPGWTNTGSFDLTNVNAIALIPSTGSAANIPSFEVLDWALVPKPTRSGVLVLHCDDVDTDIELCDWLDTNIPGAHATLYVREADAAGTLEYQRVQSNGHLVCHYMENFTTPAEIGSRFAAHADLRNWMIQNGFQNGSRFGVMGGGSTWGGDYEIAWPIWFDAMTFMDTDTNAQVHSPYHHSYMSRARHTDDWVTGGGAANTEMTNLVNGAVSANGRAGVLVHDLGSGAAWTNITGWLTSVVKPLVDAGTLRVLNAREAWLEGF